MYYDTLNAVKEAKAYLQLLLEHGINLKWGF
jgi:hypothetical protein